MEIEAQKNQIVLKKVYNTIVLETREGKRLYVCMRDMGFEMKVDDGNWHLITNESDFLVKPKEQFGGSDNKNFGDTAPRLKEVRE